MYLLPSNMMATRGLILDAVEIFAVAHEYAHHILRHGRLTEASVDAANTDALRKEEFEADKLAILLGQLETGNTEHENLLTVSGAGAVIMLRASEMVANARSILLTGSETKLEPKTHPTISERVDSLDQESLLWPKHQDHLRDVRKCFDEILQGVWTQLIPIFLSLHEYGVRPIPMS
jgi:hypothetical protein